MENEKYFVILSSGAYSDYSPNYYMGEVEITDKEFDRKGIEVGDKLIEEYLLLPERPSTSKWSWEENKTERYDEKGEVIYPPGDAEFEKIMEKWLLEEKGYEKLPEDIPEINCAYSDIPNSKNWKRR